MLVPRRNKSNELQDNDKRARSCFRKAEAIKHRRWADPSRRYGILGNEWEDHVGPSKSEQGG